jgi:hypothetical protein
MQTILNEIYKVVAGLTYLPDLPGAPPIGPGPLELTAGSLEQLFGKFFEIAASPGAQKAVSDRATVAAEILDRPAVVELEVAKKKLDDWSGDAAGEFTEHLIRLHHAVRLTAEEVRTLGAFVKAAASIYEKTWRAALEIAQAALEGFRAEGRQRKAIYVDLAKDAIAIAGDAATRGRSGGDRGPLLASLGSAVVDGIELWITADDPVDVLHEMIMAVDDLDTVAEQAIGALTTDLSRHLERMNNDVDVFMPAAPAPE